MTKILLMEGYQPEWAKATVYETDKGYKLHVNESGSGFLTAEGNAVKIDENNDFIVEKTSDTLGKARIIAIEGIFQRADTKNANGRVYPRKLFERLLSETAPAMMSVKGRAMCGHLEHPADGITDLKKIAVIVTSLKLREDGVVWGRAEVLGTTDGIQARALIEGRVRIGVSSRGRGTIGRDGVVNEDYELATFDLVYNPSTPGAFPESHAQPANVGESITLPASAGVPAEKHKELPMQFDYMAFEAKVRPLLEQDASKLDASRQRDLATSLDVVLNEGIVALRAEAALSPVLNPVIGKIQEKRSAVASIPVVEAAALTEKIVKLTADLEEAKKSALAETSKYEAAVALAEGLVTEFQARTAAMAEALEDSDGSEVSETSSDEKTALLELIEELQGKVEAGLSIIEALTQGKAKKTVKQAVESAISKNAFLSESRDLLEGQATVEQVVKVAESIAQAVKKAGGKLDESRPRGKTLSTEEQDDSSTAELDESANKGTSKVSKGAALAATLADKGFFN